MQKWLKNQSAGVILIKPVCKDPGPCLLKGRTVVLVSCERNPIDKVCVSKNNCHAYLVSMFVRVIDKCTAVRVQLLCLNLLYNFNSFFLLQFFCKCIYERICSCRGEKVNMEEHRAAGGAKWAVSHST
jgi:hypothetical protein